VTAEEALAEFRAAGAYLDGHFVLSSGLHSPAYIQCARVLMDPARAARLCTALAERVRAAGIAADLCVSPALGGILAGYELARALGLSAMFTERVEGRFAFRRGFAVPAGARVLVVEDVVTTGLSTRECIAATAAAGGLPVAAACLVDRSGGRAEVGVPLVALLTLDVPAYPADALPAELAAVPAQKPGSRGLRA
jgi:orotate phosphoribosyltransferase